MSVFPRIAVGAIQPGIDSQVITWALIDALVQSGAQVQHFLSRACFVPYHAAAGVAGSESRHLDTWLMTPELCREFFAHGASSCDLSVIEGRFRPAQVERACDGGDLDLLCQWLHVPRLAVIDASRLGQCCWPGRPEQVDGVLLDRVADRTQLIRLQTTLEAVWGVPVLGALEELPELRAAISRLPAGSKPEPETCHALGTGFLQHSSLGRIREMAARHALPVPPQHAFRPGLGLTDTRVAVAYDAAFNCYFPDTLDMLELRGATVVDFSPLRDEVLPPETDIVYLGCGHPERFADDLIRNHCLTLALTNHLCAGHRIYAEGGGLAYLCQQIVLPDGQRQPMVGALPAVAHLQPKAGPPLPVELTLAQDTWLARSGDRLRGYLSPQWRIEPQRGLIGCALPAGHEHDLVRVHQAVGSRVHLNFAAQPRYLNRFLEPQGTLCRSRVEGRGSRAGQ